MNVPIDAAGRVVIPKLLRDQVGLRPGSRVDIEIDGVALRLVPMDDSDGPEIVDDDGFLVIAAQGGQVTDDEVNALRDALRR